MAKAAKATPAAAQDFSRALAKAWAAAAGLPEVEEGLSYGTPALKLRGRLLLRIKDADTYVVMASLEEKEMLFEAAPEIYFETDHYKGWAAILARVEAISHEELAHRIALAWRARAPKSLAKAFAGKPAG